MSLAHRSLRPLAALIALSLSGAVFAYESGSTGADGALNPTVNTQIQLPANGVLNYTTVNIPAGVTVTFAKNTTNTPVVILVGGDATIAGTIEVSGTPGAATGAAGDGSIGDDGTPGRGGPGGYDGGQGGKVDADIAKRVSQAGQGPGGAGRSAFYSYFSIQYPCGGSGGGFGSAGGAAGSGNNCTAGGQAAAGVAYGAASLLPLLGGSGGSGGAGGVTFRGAGGGGGGGGLVVAASGTLSVTGTIRADGGAGGLIAGAGVGGAGGGGSGGAIRLIATGIAGNGAISAAGGAAQRSGTPQDSYYTGGAGGAGRIRLEAETYTRTAATTPVHSFGAPGPVFVAGLPSLRISKVAGVDAPAAPTGNADIALPEDTVNPVTVEVATTGVPLGNTVTITVTPAYGATSSHVSNALAGSEESATATASVTLPAGPSTLLATVSYSVPESVAMQSPYRELSGPDDLIERIALQAMPDGSQRRIATTRAGREIDLSAVPGLGG